MGPPQAPRLVTLSTIWLITTGEPLPSDEGNQRLLRTGILAETLASRGHSIVWWTSTFNHAHKMVRPRHAPIQNISDKLQTRFLSGISYRTNVSVFRQINHIQVANALAKTINNAPKPDIIICALPTIELCSVATEYGARTGVPVFLDIRDLWPDLILDIVPVWARQTLKFVLSPMFRKARRALTRARGLIAVSENYLDWGIAQTGRERTRYDQVFTLGYRAYQLPKEELEAGRAVLIKKGVNPKRKIFCFIGSFGRSYDLETVIAAAKHLKCRGANDIQFVFAGDGEYGALWRQQSSGLDNVIFVGWIEAPSIASLMDMSIAGFAAYREGAPQGLPNKLFEYMSAGLPILSSLSGEATQVITRLGCGINYPAGNSQKLAETVLNISKDDSCLASMSAKSLQGFEKLYSAENVYNKMVDFLENIVGKAE